MFRPLEELIHAYFARTWPIATCENQLDVINGGLIPILRMGASRLPVRVPVCVTDATGRRTQTGHQIPHRLLTHDPVLAFCIETSHPASIAPCNRGRNRECCQFIQYILSAPSFQDFRVKSPVPFHSRRSRINGLGTHTKLLGKYPATLSQIMHPNIT